MADYILEDDDADMSDDYTSGPPPPLAPIGTRPAQMIPRPASPKLNPAAKDFKSLFSSRRADRASRSKSKDFDADRRKENEKNGLGGLTPIAASSSSNDHPFPLMTPELRGPDDDTSPPQSRKSRDAHSVTTADSSTADYSSRNSLDRTPSFTPSDAMTPSSLSASASSNRESFMAKLTRKSSSGKFGLPVFNREKKRGGRESTILGEDEEDPLARSMDSIGGAGGSSLRDEGSTSSSAKKPSAGRSWSSVFVGKMGKGKDKAESTLR